ncbi:MAG TPA: cysteine desulfurase family protein [Acidimicrobiia bacterium]|nr:cysteine desulfurase family protein [Acidimicrobiia bacterium]
MRRAYLDHASTSTLRPAALAAMLPFLREHHADPGRLHAEGRVTRVAREEAREQVAALLGARPREVVFTASGTEAVNTAVWGAVARGIESDGRAHVVTTAVEHSAVLAACRRPSLGAPAAELTMVGVDRLGRFDPDEVAAAVRPETALVSVQLANHEVGTLQPAAEVVAECRDKGALVHVDACMAAGHVPVDFHALGADLCSVTAHKLGGPKGAGALLVRRGLRVPQLIVGGAQERARRGGLEDVPAWVGFGAAAAELDADDRLATEASAARALTDRVATETPKLVAGVTRYGDPDERVPHLICFGIEGVEAEPVLLGLDQRGVAVHSGSACSSEVLEPSPILEAMGVDAEHSLRVSVGWDTTDADIDAFLDAFPAVVDHLRALRAG